MFRGFSANCYLIKTGNGFVLIDSGGKSGRKRLEQEMKNAGCVPGGLRLVLLTHGDFDHAGNCAYLREKFKAKIAMHQDDSGMVEYEDMFWNRKSGNLIAKKIVRLLFRLETFTPDFTVDEHADLSEYGLDATILHVPGHSKGSIAILTGSGDLFCGDLLTNKKRPEPNWMADDPETLQESIRSLSNYRIKTVYPGHGPCFSIDSILNELPCEKPF